MGGAKGGRKSKRVSKKAKDALKMARSKKNNRAAMAPPSTGASATDVSRELEASPGADTSAEMGMGT